MDNVLAGLPVPTSEARVRDPSYNDYAFQSAGHRYMKREMDMRIPGREESLKEGALVRNVRH